MVAIISSNNLGFSSNSLGQRGVMGSAQSGNNGEQVAVNIATGNLVLQDRDELVAGVGLDIATVRTYNSQGVLVDNQRQNWSSGFYRQAIVLQQGVLNQAGSSLLRTERDGAQSLFVYDAGKGAYVSTDGEGAYNRISVDANGKFTWQDAASGNTMLYDANGRLMQASDTSGNLTRYGYTGDLLTSVTDGSNGAVTLYGYDANGNLSSVASKASASGLLRTRVRYDYDANTSLLTRVTVDLSPQDNSIADGNTYVTNYRYEDDTGYLSQISQSDGSSLSFIWDQVDGQTRLASVTDALNQVTTFAYDLASRSTIVTDPLNLETRYDYDAQGQLLKVSGPAVNGIATTTTYSYNERGDLSRMVDGEGHSVSYEYDAATGDQIRQKDSLGNTVERVYLRSQLITERQFVTPASGSTAASNPLTTQYVRDDKGRVRFVISPEMRTTEYRYDNAGQRITSISYGRGFNPALLVLDPVRNELDSAKTLINAISWSTYQEIPLMQRTDFHYDAHGLLDRSTQYARLDAQGNGVADADMSVTQYVYDQSGQLLQTIAPDGGSTAYTYDGLGRMLTSTSQVNGAAQTTINSYDQGGSVRSIKLANGLVTTSLFDVAGRLTSLQQTDASNKVLSQTRYSYDADGRLVQTTDATGVTQTTLYDDAGRHAATIDATGSVTEYRYDAAGHLIRTIVRASPLAPELLARLVANPQTALLAGSRVDNGESDPVVIDLGPFSASDRITRQLYDAAGRLSKTIDAAGAVVGYQYDGAGRLLTTTAFTWPLNSAQMAIIFARDQSNQVVSPDDASTIPLTYALTDRITRRFYDKDGLLRGVLDADLYLTEYQYNAQGQAALTHRYSKLVLNYLPGMALNQIQPGFTGDDIRSVTLYNAKGQVAAQSDAANYLTKFTYDKNGNLTLSQRFATRLSGNLQINTALDSPLLANATSVEDHVTRNRYDNQNRLIESVNAEGTITTYQYDVVGNLLASFTDRVAPEDGGVRGNDRRYDLQGRLTGELTGEGSRQLHTGTHTQSEIDNLWRQYGMTYTWDAGGRKTSSTDPNQHTTLYYYDADGRLQTTINAAGEVTRQDYTVQGELASIRRYATRIDTARLAALQANTRNAGAPRQQPIVLIDVGNDQLTTFAYDGRGQLQSQSDALGGNSQYTYNAFGERETETRLIANTADPALPTGTTNTTTTTATRYTYNKRGLLYSTTLDAGKLNFVGNYTDYDAFGRVKRFQDFGGNAREMQYDPLGRVVVIKNPQLNLITATTTYDAFDRILTQTDALGNATTYSYDLAQRSMTVTTAEGVKLTTVHDRHGQQASVTDALGNITRFSYDGNGQLLRQEDAIGSSAKGYDQAGLLIWTVDGRGTYTRFDYDAANRVLSKTVDPAQRVPGAPAPDARWVALNLTTTYEYDAFGQTVLVTDPKGVVSKTVYDQQGQVKQIIQDFGRERLNLTTSFSYDLRGKNLTVVDANNHATTYEYDRLGRRTSETAYADGVKLVTRYAYDRNNNVTLVIDANGNRTRFVYDWQNRVTDVVDGAGGVTHTDYDAAGNVIARTLYANAIDLAPVAALTTALSSTFIKTLLRPDADRDNVLRYAYNKDNQLRFTFDNLKWVKENQYDQAGRIWRTVDYQLGKYIEVAHPYGQSNVLAALAVPDAGTKILRQTTFAYDARNRVGYEIDAEGGTIHYLYDANDNVFQRLEYARGVGTHLTSARPTLAQVSAALAKSQAISAGEFTYSRENRNQLFAYDAANRLIIHGTMFVAARDANAPIHWLLESTGYDAVGNVIARSAQDHLLDTGREDAATGVTLLTAGKADSNLRSWLERTARQFATDRNSRMVYDSANRLIGSATAQGIDASGRVQWAVLAQSHDKVGNVLQSTAYASALTSDPGGNVGQAELSSWLQNPLLNSQQDNITQYLYDSANRRIFSINALGGVSQNEYDAMGNVVLAIQWDKSLVGKFANTEAITLALTPAGQHWSERAGWLNDGKNRLAATVYDSAGRAAMQIDALGNVVERQFDGIGNAIRINTYGKPVNPALVASRPTVQTILAALGSNAEKRTQLQYFDASSRLRYQVDALGYLTKTDYDGLDRVGTVSRYKTAQSDLKTSTTFAQIEAQLYYSPSNPLSWDYDKVGNLSSQTDMRAQYIKTQYTDLHNPYYALTPRLHEEWLEYDTAGHLARTIGVATTLDSEIATSNAKVHAITRNTYDVFGNLLARTESSGTDTGTYVERQQRQYLESDSRTTRYEYDAVGRQIKTIFPVGMVYDSSADAALDNPYALKTVTTSTSTEYDVLGNAIASRDVNGNVSYKTWDALGRLTYEIDALGYVTGFEYDRFGAISKMTRYARALALPAGQRVVLTTASVAAALAQLDHNQDRSIVTTWDQLGREIARTEPLALVVDATRGVGSAMLARTTTKAYNGYGEIWKSAEFGVNEQGVLATTVKHQYTRFDQKGQVLARLDVVSTDGTTETAWLTTMTYDYFGNLLSTKEFANAVVASAATLQAAAQSGSSFPAPAASEADRETRYEYDSFHRKIKETRINVAYVKPGEHATSIGNLITEYGYDRAGNLVSTKDSIGRITVSNYNQQGYVTAVLSNFVAGAAPLTVFLRDIRGNILKRIDYANGGQLKESGRETEVGAQTIKVADDLANDRVTTNTWDSHGHLTSTVDAEGNVTNFAYDASGRMVKQSQVVTNAAFGTREQKVTLYGYDALGHLVDTANKDVSEALNPNAALRMAHQTVNYNGFGEITGKSLLVTQGVGGAVVDELSRINYENNQYDNAGHVWKSNAGDGVVKVMQYDLSGRVSTTTRSTDNRIRDLNDVRDLPGLDPAGLLRTGLRYDLSGNMVLQTNANAATVWQTFDRWGNVLQRSDPRYTTLYSVFVYNANNQLMRSSAPVNDVADPERLLDIITNHTGYDAVGRAVVTIDGNNHLNSFQFNSNDKLVQENHADGGKISYTYNLLGDRTSQTVAIDAGKNRLTSYRYNHLGTMTESRTEAVEVFYALPDTFQEALPAGTETLMQLYALLLGSAPSRSTINAQAAQTGTRDGLISIANSIMDGASGMFPPGMSDRDFIIKLYQTGLNRVPAEAEIAGWLAIGTPPPLAAGATTVLQLYAALLGSGPDRATVDALAPQAGNDEANTNLARQILQMNPQLANLSDSDFIVKLYQNGLNRLPDEFEIRDWLGTLAAYGASRASLVSSFIHVAQASNSDGDAFNAKVLTLRAPLTSPAVAPTHAALAVSFLKAANAVNHVDVSKSDSAVFNSKVDVLLSAARPLGDQKGNVYLHNQGMQELVERYQYDELGRRIQSTNGAGESTRVQYDLENNVIRNRDVFGHDTLSYFDNERHKVREADANQHYQHWAFDSAGRMVQSNNMASVVTDYSYNGAGQLVSQKVRLTPAQIAANEKAQELRFGYTGEYQTSIEDLTLGVHSTFTYDLVGNRTGELVEDKDNNVLQKNVIKYDAANRMASVDGSNFDVWYQYDRNNNRTMVHTVYNDNKGGHQDLTQFTQYDAQNRAIVVNNANNMADAIEFTKDTHQITYDWAGNRTSDRYMGKSLVESPTTLETYTYDAAGRLTTTTRDNTLLVDLRKYDAAGRTVRSGGYGYVKTIPTNPEGDQTTPIPDVGFSYDILGIAKLYTLNVYDKSHVIRQKTFGMNEQVEDGHGAQGDDTYFLDGAGTGYDKVGNVLGYTVVDTKSVQNAFRTIYEVANGYRESETRGINSGYRSNTNSSYDVNGNRVKIVDTIGGDVKATRTFVYNQSGQILSKTTDNITTQSFIVNGELLGTNAAESVGEVANPYVSVNSSSLTTGPSYYTAQSEGESWQSIAKGVWGDSKLWYVLADANPAGPVHKGDLVKIPARPNTVNNDANTFKPYDASALTGSTTPNLPAVFRDECGGFGRILATIVTVIVQVVVTIYAGPVAGAAAGNLVGQMVGDMSGTQDGFSMKSFATSVVSAYVSQFVGGAIATNVISQGIAIATHQQKGFNWRSAAASGIGTVVGQIVGEKLNSSGTFNSLGVAEGQFARGVVTSFAAGVTVAVARGGKVSVVQVATDAFGNALGESLAGALKPEPNRLSGFQFDNYGQSPRDPNAPAWSFAAGSTKFPSYTGDSGGISETVVPNVVENATENNNNNNSDNEDSPRRAYYTNDEMREAGLKGSSSAFNSIRLRSGPGSTIGDRLKGLVKSISEGVTDIKDDIEISVRDAFITDINNIGEYEAAMKERRRVLYNQALDNARNGILDNGLACVKLGPVGSLSNPGVASDSTKNNPYYNTFEYKVADGVVTGAGLVVVDYAMAPVYAFGGRVFSSFISQERKLNAALNQEIKAGLSSDLALSGSAYELGIGQSYLPGPLYPAQAQQLFVGAKNLQIDLFGGANTQIPGALNIDLFAKTGIKADIAQGLGYLPDASVKSITAFNPFTPRKGEFVNDVLAEANRVLAPGGEFIISASRNNPYVAIKKFPSSEQLNAMGFDVLQYRVPLSQVTGYEHRFSQLKFSQSGGKGFINPDDMQTIVLRKSK